VLSGGPVVEESVGSEVTEEHELKHGKRDVAEDAVVEKADEVQCGLRDNESLSSGSSIEMLDMSLSDEGQEHCADGTLADESSESQKSIEVLNECDEDDRSEVGDGGRQQELTGTSQFVMSSSGSSAGGDVEDVSATGEQEGDSARLAASETAEQSVDDVGDGDDKCPVAEADSADEQLQQNVEMQQSSGASAALPTDRTSQLAESHDDTCNEAARFEIELLLVLLDVHSYVW